MVVLKMDTTTAGWMYYGLVYA